MFASKLTPRLLTAFVLGMGVWFACLVAAGWGATIYSATGGQQFSQKYQQLGVTGNGIPIVATYEVLHGMQNSQYHTLTGEIYTANSEELQLALSRFAILAGQAAGKPRMQGVGEAAWGGVVRSTTDPAVFYYIVKDRSNPGEIWLEGYSSRTRQRVGYIGKNGATDIKPDVNSRIEIAQGYFGTYYWSLQSPNGYQGVAIPSQFQLPMESPLFAKVCVPVADNVLIVDLNNGAVQRLLPPGETVLSSMVDRPRGGRSPRLLVRTTQTVLEYSESLEPISRWEIPKDLLTHSVNVRTVDDGSTWMHFTPPNAVAIRQARAASESPSKLLHFAADGQLLETLPIVLRTTTHATDGWETAAFTTFSPPVGVSIFLLVFLPLAMSWDSGTSWAETLPQLLLPGVICGLVVCLLMGLLSAVLTLRHARRQQLSSTECWTWFTFVLLFGPTAYLGYRFHRRWPRPHPCPTGGHTLPADRFTCPTCQASWPLPAAKGIEVLQPAGE